MIKSKSFYLYQTVIHIILILISLIVVVPIILLFISSISSEKSLIVNGYSFFPSEFSLEAYRYIWINKGTVLRAYGITIFVTVTGTISNVLLSSMMAYALSERKLVFRRIINFFIFFTMIFNGGLVPAYIMWTTTFQIKNTIWALLLPNLLVSPMNVILIRTHMMNAVPESLYEAAKIDGCSTYTIFLRIIVPLIVPAMVTNGIFAFIGKWDDFMSALLYLNKPRQYTLALALKLFCDPSSTSDWGAMFAMAILSLIPVFLIFAFFQKYLVEGISASGLKG